MPSKLWSTTRCLFSAAAIFVALFVPTAVLAAAWGAGFEASPDNADNVSDGALRIRESRLETRNRNETEMCFGTFDGDGCVVSDDGRLRLGACRPFYLDAGANPTEINAADNAASPALDDGRLLIRVDQGVHDGVTGHDGGRAYVRDETAGADTGRNDDVFESVVAVSHTDRALVTNATFTATHCAAAAAWVDYFGSSAVIRAPATGNWRGVVDIIAYTAPSTGDGTPLVAFRLRQFDGAATTTVQESVVRADGPQNSKIAVMHFELAAPAASTTFTYTLECQADSAGGADGWSRNSEQAFGLDGPFNTTSTMLAKMEPR